MKSNYKKTARDLKKILNADILALPFFGDSKRIIASSVLAVMILTAINIKLNQAGMKISYDPLAAGASAETQDIPLDLGKVEGTGMRFEITNSQYLNVVVDTVDSVKLSLESVPEMILMRIEPNSTDSPSTTITLGGLLPSTTYHKYEDTYRNHEPIVTDSDGKYTYIQGLSKMHLIFIQPRPSTKFIKDDSTGGDCTSIGIWNSVTKTCTLTSDVSGTIQIDNNGITLDGGGKTVSGSNTGSGVYILQKSNIIIKNVNINGFTFGIFAAVLGNSVVENNTITKNGDSIRLQGSYDNTITNNTLKMNSGGGSIGNGINLEDYNTNNIIANNNISNSLYGLRVEVWSSNNTVKNNTIKSNVYWGIIVDNGSSYNTFYNNYLGNTQNLLLYTESSSYWNIAKTPGKNIVGGQNIGGNFWANPSGTGFSETCTDSDGDGICDASYAINVKNTDFLPLARPDLAPPATTIDLSGAAGANSWYVSNVSVTLTASDNANGSGVAKTEYSFDNASWNTYSSVFSINTEGETTIYYRSVDNAGNTEPTKTGTVKIDKTMPGISGSAAASPNSNGWYNDNVTVRFNCNDAISGVVNPTFEVSISAEGSNQSASGICADKAGNDSNLSVNGINIDKTPPNVSVLRSPKANAMGWNNTPVTVTFAASDGLSNIDGDSASVIYLNQEGADQSANRAFKDKAGNFASGSISGINIDMTAPIINGAATVLPNANGWYNSNVTVHFTGSDTLSGLANLSSDAILANEGANQEAAGVAEDFAGNRSAFRAGNINIDKTAPVITGSPTTSSNSNGWHNTNVTVKFTASDGISGVDSITPETVISQEGTDQSIIGNAVDMAGNSASTTVSGINIDKTSPAISGAATVSPNSNGWYNSDVIIHFAASDALSGIETVSPDIAIQTEGLSQSANGSAIDKAGNSAISTVNGINIDKTAPVTKSLISGESGAACYGDDFTVTLKAADALSGVASTLYNLNSVGWSLYTNPLTISADGSHNLKYQSNDKADNAESEKTASFVIDKNPPEAVIKFDPSAKDIKVYNSENGSEAVYTVISRNKADKDDGDKGWNTRQYKLKDCADNSLVLTLKHKKEGKEVKVKVLSMRYNGGATANAAKNRARAEYSVEKDGVIKELEQDIEADKLFEVEAKYSEKKNSSEIKVKLEGRKEQKLTKEGMIILELMTDKGDLKYGY